MIFVTGPAGAGKMKYVLSLGYSMDEMSVGKLTEKPVIIHIEDIVMAWENDLDELIWLLGEKEVVVCDEVGSGIIPMGRDMREAREKIGRVSIELAKKADRVVRVICGIPQIIKQR